MMDYLYTTKHRCFTPLKTKLFLIHIEKGKCSLKNKDKIGVKRAKGKGIGQKQLQKKAYVKIKS